MGVFFRELGSLYTLFVTGQEPALPEPSIQYADFSVWQRQWLQGKVLAGQVSYWKQQLAGASTALPVPTDYPRPPTPDYRGASQSQELPPALTAALKAFSREEDVTLFMTVLAAFQVLLSRYSGQEDIVVGTPIANRNRVETEGLIGFFVNTLVLRTDLSGDLTFRELLSRVRAVTLGAYGQQDLPFEKLVEELRPQRELGRNPLFEVLLNFFERTPELALEGMQCEVLPLEHVMAKFPLTVYVKDNGDTLHLQLVYQRALFSAERMTCLLDQFRSLLEQIVAAPQKSIRSYSLVTPDSRSLLPDPANVLPEPSYELVTAMFLAWVRCAPTYPAVRQGGQVWTYQALAERAQALAHRLIARGLQPGEVVAVRGPRGFSLVASMMAVFLSGGVLLTLDRRLPVHRQQFMVREAGAKWLLQSGNWKADDEWIRELPFLAIIDIDHNTQEAVGRGNGPVPEMVFRRTLTGSDPAYIFFTSGTTGVPKGILGSHKGLSHFLSWQRKEFAVGPQDRCAQLLGLSFDAVLRDVFLPLTSGATLCLPQEEKGFALNRILSWLEHEEISLLHTVPSLAQSWLEDLPPGLTLPALRRVFFTGEPLTGTLVRRWRETFPQAGTIINLYGPTETTLVKCFYRVPVDEVHPGVQPVGWALPETQALVIAGGEQLCGVGEVGEIVLRTPFRTLGYINAPEEQHKRFVPNPWRDDATDLLYYTGDEGRYRPDGSLEILGRVDHQVKIRGVRIEPDEVTATLVQHPSVAAGIVVAHEDAQGQTSLVAYVVERQPRVALVEELRAFLRGRVPTEMVPTRFMKVERLPLTPNGKVDRKALPAVECTSLESARKYEAPRTPEEEIIAGIWAQVLGLERVGIHDNFFELGGHSLKATQVMARLRTALQLELPLRILFEAPTVAGLASVIAQSQERDAVQAEFARLVTEVENLSEEEAQRVLSRLGHEPIQ